MNIIEKFYDQKCQYEWDRLEHHRMEFEVTMLILKDYLPKAPLKILDVGAGPGRYSIELAKQGYEMTLVDLSKNCLDFAKNKADHTGVKFAGYVHGNALNLSQIEEQSYDVILLMGPLYHLLKIEERQKALNEAIRVLKPGGLLFASFISRYAQMLYSLSNEPMWIVNCPEQCEILLSTGALKCQSSDFTDAYCAHPSEITPFMEKAGLITMNLVGCEGISYLINEKINEFKGLLWQRWVEMNYRLGKDPALCGTAAHLIYIGRKE